MGEAIKASSSSALQTKIDDYRVKIDKAISTELEHHKDSVFFAPIKRALKGGKRLRPILLILSFESTNSRDCDPFPAAVAVEFTHLESLIHDDIIDMDSVRRERPAFHALHGYEMALLSADFILSMILDITARHNIPRISQTLAETTSSMCEGELEELRTYKKRKALSTQEYIDVVSKKTASLFEASAVIGAIIGGASKEEVKALANYGKSLGIAYQIQDDIKDLEKTTTVNIVNLLVAGSEKIEHLQEMSNSYVLEAKRSLRKLKASEAKSLLFEFADHVVSSSIERI